jgi:regulatory protein
VPVITDIKRQKRSELRFNVYLDGKYAFALGDLELSLSGLRIGHELSREEAAQFQDQAEVEGVYSRAVRYIAVRPRSRWEVMDYLRRKEVPEGAATAAVERLEHAGLLNDQAFAASWVANRQLLRPRSRRRLEQELAAKGVARGDIQAALDELGEDDEMAALIEMAEKKRRLPQYQDEAKIMGYLARQGYPYERIKKALKIISERSSE